MAPPIRKSDNAAARPPRPGPAGCAKKRPLERCKACPGVQHGLRFAPCIHPLFGSNAHGALSPTGCYVEPLSRVFSAPWLKQALAGKRVAIKTALMDPHLVVGIGNIYAAESLFRAGIDPRRPAGSLSLARLERLVRAIKTTLNAAIRAGGSTLRDFCGPEGFGDFQARHQVYGRAGAPCPRCATTIRALRQGQRTTYFCPRCQR
jgi:formamidopyrimidine-DNA glycosylase